MIRSLSIFISALTLFTLAFSSSVLASGGGGGGGGGGGFSSRSTGSYSTPQRVVDQDYEIGKAIFTGRQTGVEKIAYCIKIEDQLTPVKRKSIKAFHKSSYENLTANLFDCNQPDTQVLDQIGRDNLLYVMYYLNKRYNLYLGGS